MNDTTSNRGRTIRIFLLDGSANGIMTAEVMNWVGKALGAPLSRLPDVIKRSELNRPGIYVLIGEDPEDPSRQKIYFGEADNLRKRLEYHASDEAKEFATRFIAFSSKDENLTKGHVRYIENRLVEIAKTSGRATLANYNSPPAGNLPEADIADMDFFIEQIQLMLPILGVSALQTAPKSLINESVSGLQNTSPNLSNQPKFELKSGNAIAYAIEFGAEFIVLKGSEARVGNSGAVWSYKPLRDKLLSQGKLIAQPASQNLIFTQDVPFSSPSAAAATICGTSINGRVAWKLTSTSISYKEWLGSKLSSAVKQDVFEA